MIRIFDTDRMIVGVLPPSLGVLGPEPSVVTPDAVSTRRSLRRQPRSPRYRPPEARRDAPAGCGRHDAHAADGPREVPGGPVFDAMKQAGFVPDAPPLKDALVGSVTGCCGC